MALRIYRPSSGGKPPMMFRPAASTLKKAEVTTYRLTEPVPMPDTKDQTWQPQPGSEAPDVRVSHEATAAPQQVAQQPVDDEHDKYAFDMSQPYIPVNPYMNTPTPLDLVAARMPAIPEYVKKHLFTPFIPDKFAPTEWLKDVPAPYGPKPKRYLDLKNSHPRDDRIVFVGGLDGIDASTEDEGGCLDVPHRYYVDGSCRNLMSVTPLLGAFFEHFDPVRQSEATFKSTTFNESKHRPSYKYYGCKSPEDIRGYYSRCAQLGTKLHANIESFLNGEPFTVLPENKKPFEQFKRIFSDKDWMHWEPFRTEWSIFDEETLLCGQIDLCGLIDRPTGRIILLDWKRTESINDQAFGRWSKNLTGNEQFTGFGVCSDIENCNYMKYSLQLNVYAYILWKNYGLTTVKMFIMQFHPKNKDNMPGIFKVRHMFPLVEQMLACRKIVLRLNGVIP